MSDEEILRLIAEAPSELWTDEQIELVRSRLADSPRIRQAMADRLRLDDLLAVTFDAGRIDPEKIVAAAGSIRPMWRKPAQRRWPWGISLAVVLALSGAAWHWWPDDSLSMFAANEQRNETIAGSNDGTSPPPVSTKQRSGEAKQLASEEANPGEESPPAARAAQHSPTPPVSPTSSDEPTKSPSPAAPVAVWDRPEHLGGNPRPYATISLIDIGEGRFTPRRDELRQWLAGLPGIQLDVQERDVEGRRCGTFAGVARLAAPWREDSAWRLAIRDANKLKLYFWRGERGVMLQYHEDRRFAWAAYVATRAAGEVQPKTLALTATDDERSYRTSRDGQATIDLFWRRGELVLARGGIELLVAPLDGPPTEVLFDGRACFLGLTMTRIGDLPPPSGAAPPTLVEDAPARLDWQATTPAGSRFDLSPSGSVALASQKTSSPAQAYTAAMPAGGAGTVREIIVRVDGAAPGASVFLADDQGRQAEVLRFMHSRATGGAGVWIVAAGDGRIESYENLDAGPAPLVGETAWLRILCTAAGMRCSLSADGLHWANPWPVCPGIAPQRLGIALAPGEEPRVIRLGQIAWRELAGIAALAPAELVAAAMPASDAKDHREWRGRVADACPANVDAATWRRAAAVAALGGGKSAEVVRSALAELVEHVAEADLPLERRLRALDGLTLVSNVWDEPDRARALVRTYAALADTPSGPVARPYTALAEALIHSPVRSRDGVFVETDRLARREILHLVDSGDWDALDRLCRTLRFRADRELRERWRRRNDGGGSMVDWAQMLARRHVKGNADEPRPAMHPAWRDPLVEQFDTDAFNVLAEFRAAVEGEAFRDAADTIATAGAKLVEATDKLGVLPDAKDEGLYVSLRVAIEQAMREHPQLESAMQERFGPTALLRVRKAIAQANVALVEAATLQYHGTAAAAEAHLWLGNRALSVGEFARALAHFHAASENNRGPVSEEARQRARLAAAVAGRKTGEPATGLVRLGDESIAADEFEHVLDQLVARAAASPVAVDSPENNASRVPVEPVALRAVKRGDFRVGPIQPPRATEDVLGPRVAIDWFARTAAMAAHENLIVINGRTSAVAFDTEGGGRIWEAALRSSPGDAKQWPIASAQPLVVENRVMLRWLAKDGPVLVCLDAHSGRQLWQAAMESRQAIVGDPVFAQDDVFAIAAQPDALGQAWQISLVSFDDETGALLRSRPLVRLGEAWRELGACRATLDRDRLYVALGSAFVCCDLSGQVHWVRSLPHVPASVDGWCFVQAHDAPIVQGNRVFVAAPTVRKVVCLETASGRMAWQYSDADIVQLAALAGGCLVVRNGSGLAGLRADDGSVAWRFLADEYCRVLAGPDVAKGILIATRPDGEARSRGVGGPTLVWLDPASGKPVGRWSNEAWKERGGQFGPLAVSAAGRIWGLWGASSTGETREVVELFPPGVEPLMPPSDAPKDPPAANGIAELQKAADKTLPGWIVASGVLDPAGTLVKHLESDDTVLAIADARTSVGFTHQAAIAPGSKGRLRIKAGYAANEAWAIRVAAGDRVLLEKTIGGRGEPGWERFELELAPLAGQAVTFEVSARSPDGKPRRTLWKRLQVTP